MSINLIDWVDCAICQEEAPTKTNVMLPCTHEYHIPCLRDYLQVLKKGNKELMSCPQCRKQVPQHILDAITYQLRSLSFKYTLSPQLSRNLDLSVCVAFQPQWKMDLIFLSDQMRIKYLPQDTNFPGQVYIDTYIDVEIEGPESSGFFAWIQDGNSGAILSPIKLIMATSEDDD